MRKNVSKKTLFYVCSIISMAILCFIFSQSILSREESGALSAGIMAFLKPLLDPHNRLDADLFHFIIRKAAHFTEFAAFGFFVAGAVTNLGHIKGRRFLAFPMLITLVCAVSDEFLQYFTGRGSMVTDVVLDYAGALFGMALLAVFHWCRTKK